jgi:serine/threonine protein kinase
VFELLSLNLYELLRNTKFTGVSLKLLGKFTTQLLMTLAYLTCKERGEERIIHCDLKPENILLRSSRKSAIKVIDFGSACFAHAKAFTYIQSRFYRAAEVILGLNYNPAIDV